MSRKLVSVEPIFGTNPAGVEGAYVVVCVPTTGAALTIAQSQILRAELLRAEEELAAALALSDDQRALLTVAAEGSA